MPEEKLSLIEQLLQAVGMNLDDGVGVTASIIISLGVVLICGFLMTRLTKLLKLPNVTAYIITGILIGPFVINLIPHHFIEKTDFISDIALAFIAFTAGQFFKISELKKAGWKVIIITIFEAMAAFIVVFLLCKFAFKLDSAFSLVLAALSSATAPASTMMTIKQTKAKGDYVNTLLEVVALDDVVTLILYSVAISICMALMNNGKVGFMEIGWPIVENLICLVIGFIFGFVLRFLISSKRTTDNRLIIVVAVLLLFCGICALFGQSPLLGCMAIGMVYTNTAKNEEKLFAQVNYFIPPIMLIFFVRSGMNFNFGAFTSSSSIASVPLIVIAVVYFFARIIGKYGGAYLGGLITRAPAKTRNYLGLGLIPQAGVAIGLAAMGARVFASSGTETGQEMATALTTIILASSILYELIGPGCAKLGLFLSHSYGHDDISDVAPVNDLEQGIVENEGSSKEIDTLVAQINQLSKEIAPLEPEAANEEAFTEAAEEYENEVFIRNHRGFINRK